MARLTLFANCFHTSVTTSTATIPKADAWSSWEILTDRGTG